MKRLFAKKTWRIDGHEGGNYEEHLMARISGEGGKKISHYEDKDRMGCVCVANTNQIIVIFVFYIEMFRL